jgi:hypothetical protein
MTVFSADGWQGQPQRTIRLLSWCVICLVALGAPAAAAYQLYTVSTGESLPLRWCAKQVFLQFDASVPAEFEPEAMREAVAEGFERWSSLPCEEDELAPFEFVFTGVVEGARVGYDKSAGAENENLVTWVQSAAAWAHGSAVLALTSLTFDTLTGEIVDADLEINDAGFVFSLTPTAQEIDLLNTVVHEAGHFLGLDHSAVPESTMFAKALPGETNKRSLEPDDVAGFCALYGPAVDRTPCSLTPGGDSAGDTGCMMTSLTLRHPQKGSLVWGLLLLLFMAWRCWRPQAGAS